MDRRLNHGGSVSRMRKGNLIWLPVAAALAGPWLAGQTQAQPAMLTVLSNGPVSNRLNMVLLSEGYSTNQLGQFWSDATNGALGVVSSQPYLEYSNYFNAFAIGVGSVDSLGTAGSYTTGDTYFQSTCDPPNLIVMSQSGQQKVTALLKTFMPQCGLPILLVNDRYYDGGSDGFDQTAIASISPMSTNILVHETGHVLANLGDEYTNSRTGITITGESNTTQQSQTNLIPWKAWIEPGTPIPTPPNGNYTEVIGLFQGANYNTAGWYRPKWDCRMNHKETPFCEVCTEALVKAIYQHVRPVDNFTPANTNVSISATQRVVFSLGLLQPSTHSLAVQWFLDGTAIPGATNSSCVPPPPTGQGKHPLSAVVSDPTPLVRSDPAGLLTQTVTWTIEGGFARLLAPTSTSNQFGFHFLGPLNSTCIVQSTTNLAAPLWSAIATNRGVAGWITNWTATTNSSSRFYRVLVQ